MQRLLGMSGHGLADGGVRGIGPDGDRCCRGGAVWPAPRVPEDVSVIGIYDHEMAEFFDLTTVAQPASSRVGWRPRCSSPDGTQRPGANATPLSGSTRPRRSSAGRRPRAPTTMPEGASLVAVAGEVIVDLVPAEADGTIRAVPGVSPGQRRGRTAPARRAYPAGGEAGRRPDGAAPASAPGEQRPRARPCRRGCRGHVPAIVSVEEDGTVGYDFRVDGTAEWQWTDAGALRRGR